MESRRCNPENIGIISPYRKQVSKIKQALKTRNNTHNNFDSVLVGSCEQLQGQERRVIIISTVRSSTDFLSRDKFFNLGFLENPKRFNVAVTRAQALLIIIGNPHLLKSDLCFGKLLQFCCDNNAYIGTPLDAIDPVESLTQAMRETLSIEEVEVNEDEEGFIAL